MGNHFSEEPYGFAVPRGDERLLELVNHTLKEMERDGTYAAIYEKWFGDAIRPYPLEESETVRDRDRGARDHLGAGHRRAQDGAGRADRDIRGAGPATR